MKRQIDESKKVPKATRMETARRAARLTLGEAAELIGVAPSTIDRWEKYKATPTKENVILMAFAYGVRPSFFYGPESGMLGIEWNSKGLDLRYKIEK